jgi:type IV secretion system protein VirB11
MIPGAPTLLRLMAPFDPFLAAEGVREVVVNRPGEIGVEGAGGWSWHQAPELDFDRLEEIAILAGFQTSRDVDGEHPLCASTLPGGQRIQVCRPSATAPGIISLAIRKPATTARRVDDEDFEALFATTNGPRSRRSQSDAQLIALYRARDWRAFFKLARRARKSFGICGRTGSGKTDLLKRLIQLTPESVRVVSIESDAEFGEIGTRNRVSLFYGDDRANIASEDALKASLRLRPDEIWMQEVRGAEAFSYIRALAAGHPGGGTSWHAEEGQEFDALELMIKQHPAGVAIPDGKVRQLLREYIDVVVWCDRGDDGFSAPRVWFKAAEDTPA